MAVYDFFCECANRDCMVHIAITVDDYERVRQDGRRFVIKPGHHLPDFEKVVERREAFWVVEKEDDAGAFVERLDPRAGP